MGRDIRVTTPPAHDHTWDANLTAPSAPIGPSEPRDNVTIPFSAYIPSPVATTSQYRGAPNVRNRPATTWEPALEPVRDEEPVASGSTLPVPNVSSYWSNVIEQRGPTRRPRLHRRRWGRIDRQLTAEPRPPPELLAPPESRYYEYFTNETTGEGTLQELPPRPDMPFPNIPDEGANSESTPEPPQSPTDPGSTSDDTA